MRIAITADPFIPVPPIDYGGIERIIHFLVEGLANQGHEVVLVAHHDSIVSVPLIAYPRQNLPLFSHIKNLATINKIRHWKPEIIHSFSRLAYLLPFLRSPVPKLMSYQREPTIAQIRKAVRVALPETLYFTGCSNYIANQINPAAVCYTVYNGVDINKYTFARNVSKDAPLAFLGRIEPVKGTHIAINAALATNKNLVIAGNVPSDHEEYFRHHVKPHLSESITYIGPVDDRQKNQLLGRASALLMPIEWNEPFGIVMAEALACGTPVIGYNKGAVPEVIDHGVTGFVAEDLQSLCNYILKIDTLSRVAARLSAETKFSANNIVNQYLSIYQTLADKS